MQLSCCHQRSINFPARIQMKSSYRAATKKGIDIMPVKPKPSAGVASEVIDKAEEIVLKFVRDPSESLGYISGNFAPVHRETPPVSDLPVIGSLPECLNGQYLRVGPNPKFNPMAGYHWRVRRRWVCDLILLDKTYVLKQRNRIKRASIFNAFTRMIHGVRIKDGKATYVSRYVKTSRLKQEEFFGGAKFLKLGDLKGLPGLFMVILEMMRTKLKILDGSFGNGTANTALVYHHGKVLALHERDKPYVIKILEDGDLQTLGVLDYDKRLTYSFTAHPKVDPVTGEMFTFGYSVNPPYITYSVISKDGLMHDPVPITISEPVMMHDFAITEKYAIFMDLPICLRPKEMLKGKPVYFLDDTKKARFGILPRYARDELQIRWFELPSCFIIHNANAWEEGDEVVLITCRFDRLDLGVLDWNIKGDIHDELYEMRFNMVTGEASQRKLSASFIEHPRINERYAGRKQRYVYATVIDEARVTGIIKFDLNAEPEPDKTRLELGGNITGLFEMGPNRCGSEAIFVPYRPGYTDEEDDGYLIFFIHDDITGKSSMNVIDAKKMSADPIAVVELPHRVPYGFHALFMTEEQLRDQARL